MAAEVGRHTSCQRPTEVRLAKQPARPLSGLITNRTCVTGSSVMCHAPFSNVALKKCLDPLPSEVSSGLRGCLTHDNQITLRSPGENPLMHIDNISRTLIAFMAGATVGAGVGLLFTPKSGSQVRSSLREYVRKAPDEVDQAIEGTKSDAIRGGGHGEGLRMPGAECSVRSGPQDHTTGDTGHDN